MKYKLFTASIIITTVIGASSCSSFTNIDYTTTSLGQVAPVTTEYSLGLECLGELIDQTSKAPLTVYVNEIKDYTVPEDYDEHRLSHGAKWWIHTAISKLGSNKIHTTTNTIEKKYTGSNHLVFSGAWTQDDKNIKKNGGGANAQLGDFYFGVGAARKFDVIAGDFVSAVNQRVLHASAVSVAVGHNNTEVLLRVEDSDNYFELDVSNTLNEGPQFSQRRIAEAAVMIHLSRYFGINPRSCIEAGWTDPQKFRKKLNEYKSLPPRAQVKALQRALAQAGYNPGPVDGHWADRSSQALMCFQADKGHLVNGRRSAIVYAMLSLRPLKLAGLEQK